MSRPALGHPLPHLRSVIIIVVIIIVVIVIVIVPILICSPSSLSSSSSLTQCHENHDRTINLVVSLIIACAYSIAT